MLFDPPTVHETVISEYCRRERRQNTPTFRLKILIDALYPGVGTRSLRSIHLLPVIDSLGPWSEGAATPVLIRLGGVVMTVGTIRLVNHAAS